MGHGYWLGRAQSDRVGTAASSSRSWLLSALNALLIALFFVAVPQGANAQSGPGLPPVPFASVVDANGVNLTTGLYTHTGPTIHIGPQGRFGLSYTLSVPYEQRSLYWAQILWPRNPYEATIKYEYPTPNDVIVTVLGQNESFTYNGSSWTSTNGAGGTLVATGGGNFTYTDKNGVVTLFAYNGAAGWWITAAKATTTTYPDGLTLTYTWRGSGLNYVMTSLNNNLGYQIKFNYTNNSSVDLANIMAINNAVEYCSPTVNCTPSNSWPTITIAWPSGPGNYTTLTATDSLSHVWTFSSNWMTGNETYTLPTGQVITHHYDLDPWTGDPSNWTAAIGGNTWTYGFDFTSTYPTISGGVTDPNSVVRGITSDGPTGVPYNDVLSNIGVSSAISYSWAAPGLLSGMTDRSNNASSFTYHNGVVGWAGMTGMGKPLNTTASFTLTCSGGSYSFANKPSSITDANGNCTDYTYDASSGNVAAIEGAEPSSGAPRPLTTYSYTARYAWYKNSGGSIVQASVPIYLPDEIATCVGSRASCSGSNQRKTTFTYESGSGSVASNLNVVEVINKIDGATCPSNDCSKITTEYDMYGNVSSVSIPNSTTYKTIYFYDGDQRQVGVVQPLSGGGGTANYATTKTTYDNSNRVLQTEQGHTPSQSRYDFDNSFTSQVQSANTYDSTTGALIKIVGSIGGTAQSVTQYSYDAGGRLECTAVRQNPSYFGSLPDACSQSMNGSNGPDLITKNHYDGVNRIYYVETGYASGAAVTSLTNHYDAYGRLDWVEDANGNKSSYCYDADNRVSQLNFNDSMVTGCSTPVDYEGYDYDDFGNLTTKRLRSNNTFTLHYDGLERLARRQDPSSSNDDIYYTYDLVGDLLSLRYGGSGSPEITYTWDALSRKTGETSYTHTLSSQYDDAGRRTRLTYPDSNYIDYSYDRLGRMYQVKENGSTVLAQYAYDDLGRTTGITRSNSTSTSASYGGSSQSWSLSQDLASTGQDVTLAMDYTPAGQLNQRAINNSNYRYQNSTNATTNYCANGLNQYASVGGSSGSCSGGTSYSYDGRGNLTSDGSRSFSYNYDNELISVSGGASMSLGYDPAGRLHTANSTDYVYDGSQLVMEYSGSTVLRRYVPGQGADEALVWYEGTGISTRNFLHTDEQGSVIAASNGSGVGTLYVYSATGEPQGGFSGGGPIFRYTGQAQLAAAGLYYYKARVYDPALGRFLQTDPAGYGQGLNLYAYVMNNYPNATDPSGKFTWTADCSYHHHAFTVDGVEDSRFSYDSDYNCFFDLDWGDLGDYPEARANEEKKANDKLRRERQQCLLPEYANLTNDPRVAVRLLQAALASIKTGWEYGFGAIPGGAPSNLVTSEREMFVRGSDIYRAMPDMVRSPGFVYFHIHNSENAMAGLSGGPGALQAGDLDFPFLIAAFDVRRKEAYCK